MTARVRGWAGSRQWSLHTPTVIDAVVDPGGSSGFSLPSQAFASGAKCVAITSGTYVETADIVIPEQGCLIGECPGGVIIDLSGGHQILVDGSARQTTVGTVSVASGSTAVTGIGTNFTALLAGDYILLGDTYGRILAIADDFNMTLAVPYQGNAISGQNMKGQSMIAAACAKSLVLVGALGTAVECIQALRCCFEAVAVRGSGFVAPAPAWLFTDCSGIMLHTCAAEDNGERGFRAVGSTGLLHLGSLSRNNAGHGVEYDSCIAMIMDSTVITQNGGDGVFVVNQSERIQLLDCVVSYNDNIGIDTSPGSTSSIIANSTVAHNRLAGINFDGASDIVEGCLVNDNGGDGISAGDDGVISDCNILNNGGYGITMQQDQDCAVVSNVIRDNTNDGILAGADSTITGNAIHDNGGDGINLTNAADDCVVTCNRVSGNGGNGITIAAAGRRATVIGNNFRGNIGASINDGSPDAIKDTGDAGGAYNQT